MAESKQPITSSETSIGNDAITRPATNQQQPPTMESKLGVTTLRVRSKRYAFPSVIVKTDADKEGVCVMLDVGLFCPFCAKSYKSKFTHKRSRVSLARHGNSDSGSTDPDKKLMDTDSGVSTAGSGPQPLTHASRLAKPDLSALEKFSEFRSDKKRSGTNESVISQSNNGFDTHTDSSSGQAESVNISTERVKSQHLMHHSDEINDSLRDESFNDKDRTMESVDINANSFSHASTSHSVELSTKSSKVTQLRSFRDSVGNVTTEKEQNARGYFNRDQTSPHRDPLSMDNSHYMLKESANKAKVDLSRSHEHIQKQGTLYQTTNTTNVNICEPSNKDIEFLNIREQSDNLDPRDKTQIGANSKVNTVVDWSVNRECVRVSSENEVAKTSTETHSVSVSQDANINKLRDINTDNTDNVLRTNTCTEQSILIDNKDKEIGVTDIDKNVNNTQDSNSGDPPLNASFEVSSGDESYRDVDEDTLREIEQKLIENLAKMEEEERMYELQNSANAAFEQAQLTEKSELPSMYENAKVSGSVYLETAIGQNMVDSTDMQTTVGQSSEKRNRIPNVKDIYEQAMAILDDTALPEQLTPSPNGTSPSPRMRQRSASPELIMEQILDELKAEMETYTGDATLPRVFSVRREKRQQMAANGESDSDGIADVTSPLSTASGASMYENKEKGDALNMSNSVSKPAIGQVEDSVNTQHLNNGIEIHVVDHSASIHDVCEDEYLKTRHTQESASDPVSSDSKSLDVTQISMGADSVFAQSLSRSAHKFAALHGLKPKEADEIFETAFEDALDSMEDTNDWTSDYETEVVETVMQKSQFINGNTGNYREYIEQLNAQELLVRRERGSSAEHLPESRSHSVISSEGSYAVHESRDSCSPSRDPVYKSRDSRSSSRDPEGTDAIDSCISEIIEDTQHMTENINQEPEGGALISKKLKPLFCETMNIERSHTERTVQDNILFHTPTDVCAPLSPTIYPANVALAKTHKLTLLSSQDDLDNPMDLSPDGRGLYNERDERDGNDDSFNDVFVTKDDIYNPLLSMFAKEQYLIRSGSGSSPPIFERKSSMDELSESSTLSSVDEFVPEIEQTNAPPEVMQKAYEAAIEVAKMFHQHYMIHPCFHKIMEENGTAKTDDVSNEGTDHVTAERETSDAEFEHEDSINKEQTKQFLTHMFGAGHSEHKQKRSDLHSCIKDICVTCSDKPDDGEVVKSEEVTTQEVTLVFAWPKGKKGRAIKEGKSPFREMNLRRIMRSGDVEVEVIEGPTLKSIEQSVSGASSENGKFHSSAVENSTNASQPVCTIETGSISRGDTGLSGSTIGTESKSKVVSESALVRKQGTTKEPEKISIPRGIIADIDVRVTTTRFEPIEDKVIAIRKTDEEVKTVNEITSKILQTLSKNEVITQIDPHVSNSEQRSIPSNHVLSIGYLPDENSSDRRQSTNKVHTADTVTNTKYTHDSCSDNNKQVSATSETKTDKNVDETNKTLTSSPLDVTSAGVVSDSCEVKEVKSPRNIEVKAGEEEQKLPQKLPQKLFTSRVHDAHIEGEGNKNLNDPIPNQNTYKQVVNNDEVMQGNYQQKDHVTEISDIQTHKQLNSYVIEKNEDHLDSQGMDEQSGSKHDYQLKLEITQSQLTHTELPHVQITQTLASKTELSQSPTSKGELQKPELSQPEVAKSQLAKSQLSGSQSAKSQSSGSQLSGSKLSGSQLSGSQLSGSQLSGSQLSGSQLSQSEISHMELSPSKLPHSELTQLESSQTEVSQSQLPETRRTTESMDLALHSGSDPMSQWAMDILETETVLTGGPSGETKLTVDRSNPNPLQPKPRAQISHLCTPYDDFPSSDNDNTKTGDFSFHNAPTMHADMTLTDSPNLNQHHNAPVQARKRLSDTDLSAKLKEINDDLDKMFPSNKMYSSLQDLGVKGPKARSKRLSMSETLLLNAETQVRRATSEDEISDLIENCASMMEMSIRSSLELKLSDSDITSTDITVHGSPDISKAKSQKRAALPASSTLDTIHEGLANQKPPFYQHVSHEVPASDKQIKEPKTPPAIKPKPVLKPVIISPHKDTDIKSPPPTKPKPKIDLRQFDKDRSTDGAGEAKQPLSPSVRKSGVYTKSGSHSGPAEKPTVPPRPSKIHMCNVTRSTTEPRRATGNEVTPGDATTKSTQPRKATGNEVTPGDATTKSTQPRKATGNEVTPGDATTKSTQPRKATDNEVTNLSPGDTTTKSTQPEKPQLSPKPKFTQSSKVPLPKHAACATDTIPAVQTKPGKGSVSNILDFNYSQVKVNEARSIKIRSIKDETSHEDEESQKAEQDSTKEEEDIIAIMNSLERKYSTGGSNESEDTHQPWTPKSKAMRRLLQQQNVTGFSYEVDQPQKQIAQEENVPGLTCRGDPSKERISHQQDVAGFDYEVDPPKVRRIDATKYFETRAEVTQATQQARSTDSNAEEREQTTSSLLQTSRTVYHRDYVLSEQISSLPESGTAKEVHRLNQDTISPDINGNSRLMSAEDIHLMQKEECTTQLNKQLKLTGMSSSAPKIDSKVEFRSALWEKTQSDPAFDKTNNEVLQEPEMSHIDTSSTLGPRSMGSSELFYSSEATLVGGIGEESCSQEFEFVCNTHEELQLERASTPKFADTLEDNGTPDTQTDRSDSRSTLDELVQINYEVISSNELELKLDLTGQKKAGRPHCPAHSSDDTELCESSKEYLQTLCDSVVSHSIGIASEVLQSTESHSPEPVHTDVISQNIAYSVIYDNQNTITTTTNTKNKHYLSSLDDSGHYESRMDSTLDSDNVSSTGSSPFDEETLAYYKHKGMLPPYSKQMSSDSEAYTTDSEIDVNEYKTFVTDDLIRTDLDGVEVAQFNRTPSLADSSECYSQYGITPQTDTASEADTDDLFIHIPGTTFSNSSQNANTIKLLKEETDKLTHDLLASLNEDTHQLEPVKPTTEKVYSKMETSISENAIQPEPVKPVTDRAFAALDTRNVPNVLPIHHANTWSDVTNAVKPLTLLGSPAKSPSFSPTSTSAFSVRDDEYAKQSRLLLKKQAHDSSSSVENDQPSPKVSISDNSSNQSKLIPFKQDDERSKSKDQTDQGRIMKSPSKQGWQLRRSNSLDMPKVQSISSTYKDNISTGYNQQCVADPNASDSEKSHFGGSPQRLKVLHTGVSLDTAYSKHLQSRNVIIDCSEKSKVLPASILVRRHSTGSINSNVVVMDTRLKTKPPFVPRKPPRMSQYKETSL